eukprot:EC799092.1.p7 GENE.EC799092.1~~EC799092.1.p7  ORF type:complete len:50 (-),score=6.88 EC799092.1:122-271(-)
MSHLPQNMNQEIEQAREKRTRSELAAHARHVLESTPLRMRADPRSTVHQ